MLMNNNKIIITGTVEEGLCFSHRAYGENFYNFRVSVKRKSGNTDSLPVSVSERLILHYPVKGERCEIEGQIRTYNEFYDMKNHLNIVVFCQSIHFENDNIKLLPYDRNEAVLNGFICREPYYRNSPLGRQICDIILAVNRIHNKSDYIPCIAWGRNALFCSKLSVGTSVKFTGRLQSRLYRKQLPGGETEYRTAYEMSAIMIEM